MHYTLCLKQIPLLDFTVTKQIDRIQTPAGRMIEDVSYDLTIDAVHNAALLPLALLQNRPANDNHTESIGENNTSTIAVSVLVSWITNRKIPNNRAFVTQILNTFDEQNYTSICIKYSS